MKRTPKAIIDQYAPLAIVAGALLVSVPRLAAVFSAVEPPFLGLPIAIVTGPGYGLAMAGCALYIWHVYQQRKALKLAKWLLVGWVALLGIIAIILTPSIMVELRSSSLAELLPFPLDLLWSALLATSSELVVGLVALAIAITKNSKGTASRESANSAALAKTYDASCDVCDWRRNGYKSERAARNAENAHQKKHRVGERR